MWEQIFAVILIVAAVMLVGWRFYRILTGRTGSGCSCRGDCCTDPEKQDSCLAEANGSTEDKGEDSGKTPTVT